MMEAWFRAAIKAGISQELALKYVGEVTEDPGYYERVGFGGLIATCEAEASPRRSDCEQYQWEQDGKRVIV